MRYVLFQWLIRALLQCERARMAQHTDACFHIIADVRQAGTCQMTPLTRSSNADKAALAPSPMAMIICL